MENAWKRQDGMESKELSHESILRSEGGFQAVPRWPAEHAAGNKDRHVP